MPDDSPVCIQLSAGRNVAGTVTDFRKNPITEAEISFKWGISNVNALTDKNGDFVLKGIPEHTIGYVTLSVAADGFESWEETYDNTEHPLPAEPAVVMKRIPMVHAQLRERTTEGALSRLPVRIKICQTANEWGPVVHSSINGEISFLQPNGDYEIIPEGYRSLTIKKSPVGEREHNLGTLLFERGPDLRVFVVDENEKAVQGVKVAFGYIQTTTDARGCALLRGLPELLDYVAVTSGEKKKETLVEIEPEVREKEMEVSIKADFSCTVEGRIVDHFGGPAEGVFTYVVLARPLQELNTRVFAKAEFEDDGFFIIRCSPRSELSFTIYARGCADKSVNLLSPEEAGQRRKDVSIVLERQINVSGVVTTRDGRPVERARIELYTSYEDVWKTSYDWSENNGSFSIPCPEPGSFFVQAVMDGYASKRIPVNVLKEGVGGLHLPFEPGRTVSFRVVDNKGEAVEDAWCEVSLSPPHLRFMPESETGAFEFEIPREEEGEITAGSHGFRSCGFTFSDPAEIPDEIVLFPSDQFVLSGQVFDSEHEPIPSNQECMLHAYFPELCKTKGFHIVIGENGAFSSIISTYGDAEVSITDKKGRQSAPVSLQIKSGRALEGLAFQLLERPTVSVEVMVTDMDRRPLSKALVFLEVGGDDEKEQETDTKGMACFRNVFEGIGVVEGSWEDAARRLYGVNVVEIGKDNQIVLILDRMKRKKKTSRIQGTISPFVPGVKVDLFKQGPWAHQVHFSRAPFSFRSLYPGDYTVIAQGEGFYGHVSVTLREGDDISITVPRLHPAELSGEVVLGGAAPEKCTIKLLRIQPGYGVPRWFTVNSGEFITWIPPGTYGISVKIENDASYLCLVDDERITLSAGEKRRVSYMLPAGRLLLHLQHEDQNAGRGEVVFRSDDDNSFYFSCDFEEGLVSVNTFPAGSYKVQVSSEMGIRKTFSLSVEPDALNEKLLDLGAIPELYESALEVRLPNGAVPYRIKPVLSHDSDFRPDCSGENLGKSGKVCFSSPEGTITGTVEVEYNLTYRVGPFPITQTGENRIVIDVQPGGVILSPGYGQGLTVVPMEPDNPVAKAEFGFINSLTLQRLVNSDTAKQLLMKGGGVVAVTPMLPPGDYKVMMDEKPVGATAHVEMGKGAVVFIEDN